MVSSSIKGVILFVFKDGDYVECLEIVVVGVSKVIVVYEEYFGYLYFILCLNIVFMLDEYVGARDSLGACMNIYLVKWLIDLMFNMVLFDVCVYIVIVIV